MAAQTKNVLLTVQETAGVVRKGWPVTTGVPFADGQVRADAIRAGQFLLVDADGRDVTCQAEVAATWGRYPDGSNGYAKWVHVTFLVDVPAGQTKPYRLEYGEGVKNRPDTQLAVDDAAEAVTVTTGKGAGALRLVISKDRFNVLDEVFVDVAGDGFGPDDRIISPRRAANLWVGWDHNTGAINTARPELVVEQAGPVMAVVRVKTKLDARFESIVRIFAYAGSPYVRIQETLVHGPTGQDRSAVQAQAVVMKSHVLELPVNLDPAAARATVGTGEALPEPAKFSRAGAALAGGVRVALEQDLRHPCIPNNIDEDRLSKAFQYAVHADHEPLASGRRAPGWIDVSDGRWGVTAAVRYFWQSFPKRLAATARALRLEHWAEGTQLDPLERNYSWMGMAKTHDVLLCFHTGDAAAANAEQVALGHVHELFARCEPAYYCATGAHGRQPLTPAVQDGKRMHPEYDEFVACGLNRERTLTSGFYYFRETEDDYGYFNFGDFLVSRYWGCQEYDPAFAMVQQFYRTAEPKYLEFAAECARHNYDIDFTHTYTPESSNYPQRSHDKSGSHFAGEDSHGQRETNTDPGHVFLAGLVNYWYLTGDPRARDVIFWSLPVYLAEDWYRMSGSGTWRYLGGYFLTVMAYAYELTWDDRYVEPMLWAVREFFVNGTSRHEDGVWWNPTEDKRHGRVYMCQTWLPDSVTNGYTQLLDLYPGLPYREAVEGGIIRLANFMLEHGITKDYDGVYASIYKPSRSSDGYYPPGSVYAHSMPNMVILTLARAWHLTGERKYLEAARRLADKAGEHKHDLHQLKPVTQGTYYLSMLLPYLEGSIQPRAKDAKFAAVEPAHNWLANARKIAAGFGERSGVLFVGDELAAQVAPADRRGRAFGNQAGWQLADVAGAIDDLLERHRPRYVALLVGGADLPIGHPERSDFEANYVMLLRRITRHGAVPIAWTLPPASHLEPWAWIYNTEMYQQARLHRVPLIDLHERMRCCDFKVVNDEPAQTKVPPADSIDQNRFAPGFERIARAELDRIIAQIEGR